MTDHEIAARCLWGKRFRDNAERFRRILGRFDLSPMDSLELRQDIEENDWAAVAIVEGVADHELIAAVRRLTDGSDRSEVQALRGELARRGLNV